MVLQGGTTSVRAQLILAFDPGLLVPGDLRTALVTRPIVVEPED